MTDDLRTRAREAAGMLYPEPQDDSLTYPHSAVRGYMRAAFTKGALWRAAQQPTERTRAMSEQRIPAEQMEPLARYLARDWVAKWVMSDRWMGYPDGEEQEREAMEDYLPTAREDARRYLSLAGIEVEGDESDE